MSLIALALKHLRSRITDSSFRKILSSGASRVTLLFFLSGSAFGDQMLLMLDYSNNETPQAGFQTATYWLVDMPHPLCTLGKNEVNQTNASKLHRDLLNDELELILAAEISQQEKQMFSSVYAERIGKTVTNNYRASCTQFESNRKLAPLMSP